MTRSIRGAAITVAACRGSPSNTWGDLGSLYELGEGRSNSGCSSTARPPQTLTSELVITRLGTPDETISLDETPWIEIFNSLGPEGWELVHGQTYYSVIYSGFAQGWPEAVAPIRKTFTFMRKVE